MRAVTQILGLSVLVILMAGLGLLTPAAAQTDAAMSPSAPESVFTIDLNRLEQVDRGCRIDLVIANTHESDVTRFEVDWVFFDEDGVISNRTALELAPLMAGRTAVKQFVIEGLDCTAIDSALINGMNGCETADGPVEGCLALVGAMSRSGVTLRR